MDIIESDDLGLIDDLDLEDLKPLDSLIGEIEEKNGEDLAENFDEKFSQNFTHQHLVFNAKEDIVSDTIHPIYSALQEIDDATVRVVKLKTF